MPILSISAESQARTRSMLNMMRVFSLFETHTRTRLTGEDDVVVVVAVVVAVVVVGCRRRSDDETEDDEDDDDDPPPPPPPPLAPTPTPNASFRAAVAA